MEDYKMSGTKASGKKYNQKMKPYLIYQYLLRESDSNNVVNINVFERK